ncbi:MAG TPA: hypothetical protein DDW52_29720 [Planctomycetaceae bacterium]|nr:hypothetical protein [Planctomycetaceae bacterium]
MTWRRRVGDVNEAQELTQASFAELLAKNYIASAVPDRGRFRCFLLTATRHFLSKQAEKAKAQKFGVTASPFPSTLAHQKPTTKLSLNPA